jgi:hypothetical protein
MVWILPVSSHLVNWHLSSFDGETRGEFVVESVVERGCNAQDCRRKLSRTGIV